MRVIYVLQILVPLNDFSKPKCDLKQQMWTTSDTVYQHGFSKKFFVLLLMVGSILLRVLA